MLILEEASRLDEAVFKETIAPLLGVEHTALLAISTPLGEVSVRLYSRIGFFFRKIARN